ncbi:MAG: ParB N-terminal domain-containing protein [Gemmatimonadetes bacterium]|nr:ParB N-terminal domain-containing protein [Gemmatimonadota bacterium]
MNKAPFQLLPELSAEEYTALRESIAADGILVPIQVDEDGVILDGHHRHAIAAELGINCPTVVVSNLDTDTDKRTVALALNLSRRHLNREQTRQVIAASITADPRMVGLSPEASALWLRAGSWAAGHHTDGFVPDDAIPQIGGHAAAGELVRRGLWEHVGGGWLIVDWHVDVDPPVLRLVAGGDR